jgi:hypothetical protein
MKAALQTIRTYARLGIVLVNDREMPDVILDIGYTFAWDYPFSLKHQHSSVVLRPQRGPDRSQVRQAQKALPVS